MIHIAYNFPAWSEEDRAGIPITHRDQLVFATANAVLDRYVDRLPVDPLRLASLYGITVLPLSWYEDHGLSASELFQVWGNTDGVASKHGGAYTINYNDRAPRHRVRFTLMEELMHVLLGHVEDPRFSVWSQTYSEEVYRQYEAEAKTAAGLVLFPASLWARHKGASDRVIGNVLDLSAACVYTMRKYYEDHEQLVLCAATHRHLLYDRDAIRGGVRIVRPVDVWPSEQELRAV